MENMTFKTRMDDILGPLFEEAQRLDLENREFQRLPLSKMVWMETESSDTKVSALVHDISPVGIGLMHSEPIQEQSVVQVYFHVDDKIISIQTCIEWTKSCGMNIYRSGGSFLGGEIVSSRNVPMSTDIDNIRRIDSQESVRPNKTSSQVCETT